MAKITLRVLDGADRGRVFENIEVPVTIGREEGNSIQLNDERISRFHLKIQQDHEDIVLTDLESTNGSRVNNEEVQLRILRHGDLITLGRSTLIFGNRKQINRRLKRLQSGGNLNSEPAPSKNSNNSIEPTSGESRVSSDSGDLQLRHGWKDDPNYQLALLDIEPPELPQRLSPGQAAKLSEMIEFLHINLRRVVNDAEVDNQRQCVDLTFEQWQRILDLQFRLAEYLREIGSPSR